MPYPDRAAYATQAEAEGEGLARGRPEHDSAWCVSWRG